MNSGLLQYLLDSWLVVVVLGGRGRMGKGKHLCGQSELDIFDRFGDLSGILLLRLDHGLREIAAESNLT